MEIIDAIFSFIQNGNLAIFFIKLFSIILAGANLFVMLIMIQQVTTLKNTLNVNDKGILILVARVQFVLAAILLLYAIAFL